VRTKLRIHAAALLIAVSAMLAFGSTVATAGGKHKNTLRLVATENQSDFLDLGAPGPSLGDELVISERLSHHGREVGESGIVCVVTEATPPYDVLTLHCVATLSLRRGQITLQGLIEVQGEGDSGPFTVAITGGTGAFFGAGGEARIRNVSDMVSVYKLRFADRKKHKYRH
jgi:Allene oxide cyclase barrel like domain